jgi:hypothetical protein
MAAGALYRLTDPYKEVSIFAVLLIAALFHTVLNFKLVVFVKAIYTIQLGNKQEDLTILMHV